MSLKKLLVDSKSSVYFIADAMAASNKLITVHRNLSIRVYCVNSSAPRSKS